MGLKFKNTADIKAAQYEGIKVLPRTPKNPEDYHALQDILRHRQVYLAKELYGNARLTSNPYSVLADGTVRVNGVWYLDGYRMELNLQADGYLPQPPFNETYYLALLIKFVTIDFTEDQTIALKDPLTKKIVPTSERYKFVYSATIINDPNVLSGLSEYDATYVLANIQFQNGQITFSDPDDIFYISLKYAEAAELAASAIHKDREGWANIDKLRSSDKLPAYKIYEDDHEISFVLEGKNGRRFVLKGTKSGDDLFTSLSLYGFDPNENITIDSKSLSLKSGLYSFDANDQKFQHIIEGGHSFETSASKMEYKSIPSNTSVKAELVYKNLENWSSSVNLASGSSTVGSSGYGKASAISSSNFSTYTFSVLKENLPQDYLFKVNSRLSSEDLSSGGILVTFTYIATSGEVPIQKKFYSFDTLDKAEGDYFSIYGVSLDSQATEHSFQLKYELQSTSGTARVEFSNMGNVVWKKYDNPLLLFNIPNMVIGDFFFFTDSNGALRVKRVTTDVDALSDAHNQPAGSSVDDPGGKLVGSGSSAPSGSGGFTDFVYTTDNDKQYGVSVDGSVVKLNLYDISKAGIDANLPALIKKSYFDGVADQVTQYGVTIQNHTDELGDIEIKLNQLINTDRKDNIPAKVAYVSPSWTGQTTPAFPYFTTITGAVEALKNTKGTVFVMPGEYTEDIVLRDGVDIIALDPNNTILHGTISDATIKSATIRSSFPYIFDSDNGSGVKCYVKLNVDNANVQNLPCYYIIRPGSEIKSEGLLLTNTMSTSGTSYGIGIGMGTVIVTSGTFMHKGDMGNKTNLCGGIHIEAEGAVKVFVDGNIWTNTRGIYINRGNGYVPGASFVQVNGNIFHNSSVRGFSNFNNAINAGLNSTIVVNGDVVVNGTGHACITDSSGQMFSNVYLNSNIVFCRNDRAFTSFLNNSGSDPSESSRSGNITVNNGKVIQATSSDDYFASCLNSLTGPLVSNKSEQHNGILWSVTTVNTYPYFYNPYDTIFQ